MAGTFNGCSTSTSSLCALDLYVEIAGDETTRQGFEGCPVGGAVGRSQAIDGSGQVVWCYRRRPSWRGGSASSGFGEDHDFVALGVGDSPTALRRVEELAASDEHVGHAGTVVAPDSLPLHRPD